VFVNVAPAHVVVAEFDPLRDDGVDYAARLRDNGVSVSVDHHADQMHGFFTLPHVLPGGHEAVTRAAQFLCRD
jgi:acetyl esterase